MNRKTKQNNKKTGLAKKLHTPKRYKSKMKHQNKTTKPEKKQQRSFIHLVVWIINVYIAKCQGRERSSATLPSISEELSSWCQGRKQNLILDIISKRKTKQQQTEEQKRKKTSLSRLRSGGSPTLYFCTAK